MKTKKTKLEDFAKYYTHPSLALFRAIELATLDQLCRGNNFEHPSLDLGCGDGLIASLLFDDKFSYGLDNNEAGDVAVAQTKGRYGKILIEDATEISLADCSIRFVFSNCVIEHIQKIDEVLSEVSRIMKLGGTFVFTVPSHKFSEALYLYAKLNYPGVSFLANYYAKKRNEMLKHFNLYSHKNWAKKLKENGFESVSYKYYISKEALMLWDKMALEIFLRRKFDNKVEARIVNKYLSKIQDQYRQDLSGQGKGVAALAIIAKKYQ